MIDLNFLGAVIPLFGLSIAIFKFFIYIKKKSWKDEKSLSCQIIYDEIYRSQADNSNNSPVIFMENEVTNIWKSRIYIWNSGKKTIYGKNVSKSNQLRVDFINDSRVIWIDKTLSSEKHISPEIHISDMKNCCFIEFDYLNESDGFYVEIIHDGSEHGAIVSGSIAEIKKITNYGSNPNLNDNLIPILYKKMGFISLLIPLSLMSGILFSIVLLIIFLNKSPDIFITLSYIFVYLKFISMNVSILYKIFSKKLNPPFYPPKTLAQ